MSARADFWYLFSAAALFVLFALDVLVGKAALYYDFKPMLKLGDVGEFLVLLAAVVLFVVEVLRREMQENDHKIRPAEAAEEESK